MRLLGDAFAVSELGTIQGASQQITLWPVLLRRDCMGIWRQSHGFLWFCLIFSACLSMWQNILLDTSDLSPFFPLSLMWSLLELTFFCLFWWYCSLDKFAVVLSKFPGFFLQNFCFSQYVLYFLPLTFPLLWFSLIHKAIALTDLVWDGLFFSGRMEEVQITGVHPYEFSSWAQAFTRVHFRGSQTEGFPFTSPVKQKWIQL